MQRLERADTRIRVDMKKGGLCGPAHLIDVTHEPCWIRTSDPLLKSSLKNHAGSGFQQITVCTIPQNPARKWKIRTLGAPTLNNGLGIGISSGALMRIQRLELLSAPVNRGNVFSFGSYWTVIWPVEFDWPRIEESQRH